MIFETLMFAQFFLLTMLFFTQSPLTTALLVLALSLLQGWFGLLMISKWIGLSTIIVFVGGMMVVFLYVSTLAPNNKLIISTNLFHLFGPLVVVMFFLFALTPQPLTFTEIPSNLFCGSSVTIIILILYLLMALFIATKISESFKGSLVEKF